MQPVPTLLLTELHTLSSCCSTHPFGWELAFAPLFPSWRAGMRGDRADQGLFSEGLRSQTASVLTAAAPSGAGRARTTAADPGTGVEGSRRGGAGGSWAAAALPLLQAPRAASSSALLAWPFPLPQELLQQQLPNLQFLLDETNSSTPFFASSCKHLHQR